MASHTSCCRRRSRDASSIIAPASTSTSASSNPKDIEGKKVGVRTYTQTTALWIRGILRHEYGVDLDKVTWMTLGDGHLAEYRDPNNCERLPAGSSIPQMMLNGELAAALLGEDMPKDERVRTLVPDAQAAAKDWFAREDVVPINHMFVVHEDMSKQRPDVVRELYRMIVESRSLRRRRASRVPADRPGGEPQGAATGNRLGARPEDHSPSPVGRRTVRRCDRQPWVMMNDHQEHLRQRDVPRGDGWWQAQQGRYRVKTSAEKRASGKTEKSSETE